ncbi:MAG: AAA family ATPase [Clostridia bacterium]
MDRKIYNEILNWKNNEIKTPLMIIGARQIGKTYIVNEFCKNEFDNYIYLNLFEHPEIVKIFAQNINTEEKFNRLKLYLNKQIDLETTVIFFDEIQESEELISSLKYFNESNLPYKIICAGSLLGVKLNRFHSSFPVGKVRMINMNPMDFEEFLLACESKLLIDEIYKCYKNMIPMDEVLHDKLLNLYRLYLCIGGMPEAIKNFIKNNKDILNFKSFIIDDIVSSYLNDMNKYVINDMESVRIESIYKSIPTQLGNSSNKFQYSKINKSARSREYESALNWILSSGMVYQCFLLNSIGIPPKAFIKEDSFKLYVNDIGILTSLLEIKYNDIILDKSFIYKGVIAENYVACQLLINKYSLYYWNSKNSAEIDFVIYTDDGLIPVEVKSKDNITSKSLNMYMKRFNPKYGIRISSKNFGFQNNIKSIPLYATFCIK